MLQDSMAAISSMWSSMTNWLSPTVLFVLLNVMIGIIAFTSTLANQTKHNITNRQEHSQNNPNQHHLHHQQQQNRLARSPSLLDRVKSINFYSYISQEPNLVTGLNSQSSIILKPCLADTTNLNLEHTQKLENPSHCIFKQPHQENEPNYSHQDHQESNLHPQVNDQHNFKHTQEEKFQKIDSFSTNINEFEQLGKEEEDDDELQSMDEVYSKLTGKYFIRTNSDTKPSSGEAPPKLPEKMRKSASLKSAFGHFEAEDIVESRRPATVREMEMEHGVDAKADDFITRFKAQLKLQKMDSIMRYKEMITRGSGK